MTVKVPFPKGVASAGSLFPSKEDSIVPHALKQKRPARLPPLKNFSNKARIDEANKHVRALAAALSKLAELDSQVDRLPTELTSWLNTTVDSLDDAMYHHKLISVKKPPSHDVIVKKRTEYADRRWKKRMAMLTKSLSMVSRKIQSAFKNFPPELVNDENTAPDTDD